MTVPESAVAPEQASLLEDFVDIIFSPSKVFARRATASPWAPLLIVAIVMAALVYVNAGSMQSVMDAEVDRAVAQAMAGNPNISEDQLNGMRTVMESSMKWGALVFMPIALVMLGFGVWLVGKAMGGTLKFGAAVMIAAYAYVPRVLEQMLIAIQALVLDTSGFRSQWQFSLGVGRFMDPDGPQGLLNTLGRFNLFTLWTTVLLVLGLMYAGKVAKEKAIAGGVILFVLGGVPFLFALIKGV